MLKYEFTVSAVPRYLASQSSPDENQYLFAYTVTIRNTGEIAGRRVTGRTSPRPIEIGFACLYVSGLQVGDVYSTARSSSSSAKCDGSISTTS